MSPEYLLNIPVHILHLYIRLFNEQEEEKKKATNANNARRSGSNMPRMVGNDMTK